MSNDPGVVVGDGHGGFEGGLLHIHVSIEDQLAQVSDDHLEGERLSLLGSAILEAARDCLSDKRILRL